MELIFYRSFFGCSLRHVTFVWLLLPHVRSCRIPVAVTVMILCLRCSVGRYSVCSTAILPHLAFRRRLPAVPLPACRHYTHLPFTVYGVYYVYRTLFSCPVLRWSIFVPHSFVFSLDSAGVAGDYTISTFAGAYVVLFLPHSFPVLYVLRRYLLFTCLFYHRFPTFCSVIRFAVCQIPRSPLHHSPCTGVTFTFTFCTCTLRFLFVLLCSRFYTCRFTSTRFDTTVRLRRLGRIVTLPAFCRLTWTSLRWCRSLRCSRYLRCLTTIHRLRSIHYDVLFVWSTCTVVRAIYDWFRYVTVPPTTTLDFPLYRCSVPPLPVWSTARPDCDTAVPAATVTFYLSACSAPAVTVWLPCTFCVTPPRYIHWWVRYIRLSATIPFYALLMRLLVVRCSVCDAIAALRYSFEFTDSRSVRWFCIHRSHVTVVTVSVRRCFCVTAILELRRSPFYAIRFTHRCSCLRCDHRMPPAVYLPLPAIHVTDATFHHSHLLPRLLCYCSGG